MRYLFLFLLHLLYSCSGKEQENLDNKTEIIFNKINTKSQTVSPDTIMVFDPAKFPSKELDLDKLEKNKINPPNSKFLFEHIIEKNKNYYSTKWEQKSNPMEQLNYLPLKPIINPIQSKISGILDEELIKKIDQEHNLIGSSVNCFAKDNQNRLWIGTDGGLAVYNGFFFEVYNTENNLSHNYVTCIEKGLGDTMYVGTKGGVNIFCKDKMSTLNKANFDKLPSKEIECISRTTNFLLIGSLKGLVVLSKGKVALLSKSTGFKAEQLKSIEKTGEDKLLLAYNDFGVFELDLTEEVKVKSIIAGKSVNKIKQISNHIYFANGNRGLSKIQNDTVFNLVASNPQFNTISVTDIEYSQGNLFFSSFGKGVYKLENNTLGRIASQTLSDYSNCLMTNDNNLFIGGGGGLFIIDNKFKFMGPVQGLASSIPTALNIVNSKLWVATINGGISIVDKSSFQYLNVKNGLNSNNIMGIYESKSKRVLIASSGNGLDVIENKKLYNIGKKSGIEIVNVNCVIEDIENNVWIGTNENGLYKWNGKTILNYSERQGIKSKSIYGLNIDKKGNILISTNGDGFFVLNPKKNTVKVFDTNIGIKNNVVYCSEETPFGIFFGTYGSGLYLLKNLNELFYFNAQSGIADQSVLSLKLDKNNNLFCGTAKGLSILKITNNKFSFSNFTLNEGLVFDDFFPNAVSYDSISKSISWGCHDYLLTANPNKLISKSDMTPYLSNIKFGNSNYSFKKNEIPEIESKDNKFSFNFSYSGEWFLKSSREVRFSLTKIDKTWVYLSGLNLSSSYSYNNLSSGNYTFKYSIKTKNGLWTEPQTFGFNILPPWYQTYFAYGLYFLIFVSSVVGFSKYKNKQLIKKNIELERVIGERTKEIILQKEEIERSKYLVEEQNHELAEKNHEIIQSLTYAKRLQEAILPPYSTIDKYLKEYFILYLPKDIVAGDFYWFENIEKNNENLHFFAAADCTGHGVPGAMVSVVCSSALNRALLEFGIHDTGQLLDKTKELVIETFQKSKEEVKDGMDISLCCFNNKTRELHWSGANNPLWILRKDGQEIEAIKPDKQPIGKSDTIVPFTTNTFKLESGDSFYIFTDGYQDQFGGEKGKKFMAAKMKEMFVSVAKLPMHKQKEIVKERIENWRGNLEQVDDICIWGVKV